MRGEGTLVFKTEIPGTLKVDMTRESMELGLEGGCNCRTDHCEV